MARYLLQMALLAVAAVYALRGGGRPERQTALILVAMAVGDPLYHLIWGRGVYGQVDVGHALIDFAALGAMVAVALRADRFWTLWLGAFQIIALLSHVLRAIDYAMEPLVYAFIIRGPSWCQILLLGLATWLYRRRISRRGDGACLRPRSSGSG